MCFLCPTNGRKKGEVTDTVYARGKKKRLALVGNQTADSWVTNPTL